MAQIKVLKFLGGIPTEMNTSLDDIVAKTFVVGGPSGTILTKAILDTLSSGSADASSLHNHDAQYFRKTEFLVLSTGNADASKPLITDGRGKIDPSFIRTSDLVHGDLSGLAADDHIQYHNDTRGDIRYFRKNEFINASTGATDSGKPIKTNASGKVDPTFLDVSASEHNDLAGIQGGAPGEYYHLSQSDYDTLRGGTSDASALHNHDSQYYTKTQIDSSLDTKANDNVVIKKDGSVPFVADQSMGGYRLTDLADGSSPQDAVTYSQLSTLDSNKVNKAGDAMSGNLDMQGNEVIGLPAIPTSGTAAVSKNYIDSLLAGQSWRKPADLIDHTNTSLPTGSLASIDGVAVTNGMRVLFTNLSSPSANNRVYKVSGVSVSLVWTLEVDGQAGNGAPTDGDALFVESGDNYADSQWTFTGTAWVQTSGAGQIQAGVGLAKTGNTLDINLGAGIKELPTDEIGIDLHADGGLQLVDPSTGNPSIGEDAQLAVKADNSTIENSANGIQLKDAGITEPKLADSSVSTRAVQNNAITNAKLANSSADNRVLADGSVSTSKLQSQSVTADKLNGSDIAGTGLSWDSTAKQLNVNVDGTTLEQSSDVLRVKDQGISRQKIADTAVDSTKIDFGTTGTQVNAASIPFNNTSSTLTSSNVNDALTEIGINTYAELVTAGENIGQNEMVVIRRDSSNNRRAYRASALAADNYISATLVLQDLTFTAVTPSGNNIRIRYTNPSVINAALSVSVSNADISVSLATNASGALISTASDIKAAIDGNTSAAALVSVAISGTGSTIQTAVGYTSLSGGMDYNDNGRWEAFGLARAAASTGASFIVQKLGRMTATWESAPSDGDIGKTVYLSINRGKASLAAPSASGSAIVVVGRYDGSNQLTFKPSILRGVIG